MPGGSQGIVFPEMMGVNHIRVKWRPCQLSGGGETFGDVIPLGRPRLECIDIIVISIDIIVISIDIIVISIDIIIIFFFIQLPLQLKQMSGCLWRWHLLSPVTQCEMHPLKTADKPMFPLCLIRKGQM